MLIVLLTGVSTPLPTRKAKKSLSLTQEGLIRFYWVNWPALSWLLSVSIWGSPFAWMKAKPYWVVDP